MAAEKGNLKIAVEVKSFLKASLVNEFHTVIGQYLSYHIGLEKVEPTRKLFVAIPKDAFNNLFKMELFHSACKRIDMKVLVYDTDTQTIILWKE